MKKLIDFVKGHKTGFIIGGLATVAAAVAATLMTGKEETEEGFDTEEEMVEENQDTSTEE